MLPALHILVPHALRPGGEASAPVPVLPRLQRLLALLRPVPAGTAFSRDDFSMPAERLEAGLRGLPDADGMIPWTAWELARAGGDPGQHAWAAISPCHWRVGSDHIAMDNPAGLALEESDSRALLQSLQPYFDEDGVTLAYQTPSRWLARGELFADLACASPDRVIGRRLDPWMPRGTPSARIMRRLQQEMQMLLYTHPVNDQRQAAGLLPVNSCWVSGAGRLPAGTATADPAGLRRVDTLREPALSGDAAAWAAAWETLDGGLLAEALDHLHNGTDLTLTLCGESVVRRWAGQRPGLLHRLMAPVRLAPVRQILEHTE